MFCALGSSPHKARLQEGICSKVKAPLTIWEIDSYLQLIQMEVIALSLSAEWSCTCWCLTTDILQLWQIPKFV